LFRLVVGVQGLAAVGSAAWEEGRQLGRPAASALPCSRLIAPAAIRPPRPQDNAGRPSSTARQRADRMIDRV